MIEAGGRHPIQICTAFMDRAYLHAANGTSIAAVLEPVPAQFIINPLAASHHLYYFILLYIIFTPNMTIRPKFCALLVFFMLSACAWAQLPFPGTGQTAIGGALPASYEPSGCVWHPRLQQLFLVSDDGHLARVEANGTGLVSWNVNGDLEGITIADANSNLIYIGNENPDSIIEFNFSTSQVKRTFDLTFKMTGDANLGLEGLAFVPSATDPEGGQFWAGHQGEGKIYVFSCPIRTSTTSTAVTFIKTITPVPGRTDLSDITYDAASDTIFLLYDADNRITQVNKNGIVMNEWVCPGTNQEGLALRGCELFITRDEQGGLYKYRNFPSTAPCATIWTDTTQLSISAPSTANLLIQAPAGYGSNNYYFVLGSSSGTAPGLNFGNINLPLNYDWYFDTIGNAPNSAIFINTFGLLSATGGGSMQLALPAGLPPAAIGLELDHAYLIFDLNFNILHSSGTARISIQG